MTCRFYREQEVTALLDMATTIEVVEESFRQLGTGGAENVPRHRATAPGFVLHGMHAAAEYLGFAGFKMYSTTRIGAKFVVGLYDIDSGQMVALIEADKLGQLRTAASSAVGARYLANKPITQLGIFGSGWQAESQLEAMATEFDLTQAFVYSRDQVKREQFAEKMADKCQIEVVPVHDPKDAVEDLPLVITATTSKHPVFDGNLLAEGALVCAMGGNWAYKREVDVVTIRRADNWVCDSIEACQNEAGDYLQAEEEGYFDWDKAVSLSDVIAGTVIGRNNADSIVVYKTVGLAVQDVALGTKFLQLAANNPGIGLDLPF
ncbi:ornithine cyclodeaminase family protein [Bremerella sp. T1]|uniref:ornithine cyclodeaminase family protein n=1 Tax=Bremerella sp. TYQ1 TaxID=3119568 RepID=UPI001CCA429F|nr:ornithine cyclodeaminase family protein [Bremerella volcania]UBM36072.1 ornithine cyclodeaminase family protein [Bremerella volcania]